MKTDTSIFPQRNQKKGDDDLVLEAIKMKEEKDLFFNNKDEEKKLGCIGYLRGDFGGGGREFWTTWFQHNFGERNDKKFKFIFDAVINKMREPCGIRACFSCPAI